jgi:hypothetical protein
MTPRGLPAFATAPCGSPALLVWARAACGSDSKKLRRSSNLGRFLRWPDAVGQIRHLRNDCQHHNCPQCIHSVGSLVNVLVLNSPKRWELPLTPFALTRFEAIKSPEGKTRGDLAPKNLKFYFASLPRFFIYFVFSSILGLHHPVVRISLCGRGNPSSMLVGAGSLLPFFLFSNLYSGGFSTLLLYSAPSLLHSAQKLSGSAPFIVFLRFTA